MTWADAISRITTRPEFQTSEVRIEDPSTYVRDEDGVLVPSDDTVVYEGRARVIGINRGSYQQGDAQANSTTIQGVRAQLPRTFEKNEQTLDTSALRFRTGYTLYVTSAPRQPVLTEYMFTLRTDFQGSTSASRTLEFALDLDSVPE